MKEITLNDPEVLNWTKGSDILAHYNSKYGELFVITKSRRDGHYSFLRCFSLGEDVSVSVDSQSDAPEILMADMLRILTSLM